jgi:hypothetical protein
MSTIIKTSHKKLLRYSFEPVFNSAAAAISTAALLIGVDLWLFDTGHSWTYLQYESLLPLLVVGLHFDIRRTLLTFGIFFVILSVKILYLIFLLDFELLSQVIIYRIITLFLLLIILVTFRFSLRGFLLLVFCSSTLLAFDKLSEGDRLASAITPHFIGIYDKQNRTVSHNQVYKRLITGARANGGQILVVMESLGVPTDQRLFEHLKIQYQKLSFDVIDHEGGSTVQAERRYLCGINGALTTGEKCVPKFIRGYAFHGNTLSYFNRKKLYARMGFQSAQGRESFPLKKTCRYSYYALCDDILRAELLLQVRRTKCQDFYYLLTIDSHFPYQKYSNHTVGLYNDLETWLALLIPLQKEFPKCEFIIAGDHPPPLASGFRPGKILIVSKKQ